MFSQEDRMEDRNDDTDSRCLVGDTTNKYHLLSTYCASRSFPGGTVVKNPRANAGDPVLSLGWKNPLEKEMATPSSILARKIPWTEESGRLQSMRLQRVGCD